jgi:hypothetical protein
MNYTKQSKFMAVSAAATRLVYLMMIGQAGFEVRSSRFSTPALVLHQVIDTIGKIPRCQFPDEGDRSVVDAIVRSGWGEQFEGHPLGLMLDKFVTRATAFLAGEQLSREEEFLMWRMVIELAYAGNIKMNRSMIVNSGLPEDISLFTDCRFIG